jgi:hypothetical protein
MSEQLKNSELEVINEFDLKAVFSILWETKALFLTILISFTLIAFVYSYQIPDLYLSEASLSPSDNQTDTGTGPSASVQGLAGMAGINLTKGMTQNNATLAVATIESRDFLNHLLTFDKVLPNVALMLDDNLYDKESDTWLGPIPSYLDVFSTFHEFTKVRVDNMGFVYLSVEHRSPEFAAYFVSLITQEVNNIARQRDLEEATRALDYLYKELGSTQSVYIQRSISQLIESELKTKMLANVRLEYLLRTFDKPFVPLHRSSPDREFIWLLGAILGLIIGFMSSFLLNYYRNQK